MEEVDGRGGRGRMTYTDHLIPLDVEDGWVKGRGGLQLILGGADGQG